MTPTYRKSLNDLKKRGLDGIKMILGVMDGLPGLEKVVKGEFTKAKVQRCQMHVSRNDLAKVPKKLIKAVADDLRSIFYTLQKRRPWISLLSSKKSGRKIFLAPSSAWRTPYSPA